jgi:carbamoyl-phosphate synthase large subunit
VGSESEEYTTGVFSNGSSVSVITFRRRLGYGGLSVEAKLAEEPFLEKLAEKVAAEMKLTGSINIQSRKIKDDLFMPFEINPRLSSTLLFRKKFGFDDAVWWLNSLFNKDYCYKKEFRSGVAMRFVSECYFQMEKN